MQIKYVQVLGFKSEIKPSTITTPSGNIVKIKEYWYSNISNVLHF